MQFIANRLLDIFRRHNRTAIVGNVKIPLLAAGREPYPAVQIGGLPIFFHVVMPWVVNIR